MYVCMYVYLFLLADKVQNTINQTRGKNNFSTKRGGSENSSKVELVSHSEAPLDSTKTMTEQNQNIYKSCGIERRNKNRLCESRG